MWLITTDGPQLNGKTQWLRPGKSYTFGRSKKDANIFVDSKSVSRKHLALAVHLPSPGSVKQTSVRSRITVQDFNSSFGSTVNGQPIPKGGFIDLPTTSTTEFVLQLGKTTVPATTFRIYWHPIVMTLSTGEDGPKHGEIESKLSSVLEPLDIKLLPVFHAATTHFIKASPKNSAKVLVAMVRAVPIVTSEYVSNIELSADAMELDFANFPDPSRFLPEPKFALNSQRANLFSGLKFIFFDQKQYDSLKTMIGTAGGEAQLHGNRKGTNIMDNNVSTEDICKFISSLNDSDGTRPIYLVRPHLGATNPSEEEVNRSIRINEAAAKLGRESPQNVHLINQVDFLAVIQNADISEFDKRPSEQTASTPLMKRAVGGLLTPSLLEDRSAKRQKIITAPSRRTNKIDMLDLFSQKKRTSLVQEASPTDGVNLEDDRPSAHTVTGSSGSSLLSRPQRRKVEFEDPLLNPIPMKRTKASEVDISGESSGPILPETAETIGESLSLSQLPNLASHSLDAASNVSDGSPVSAGARASPISVLANSPSMSPQEIVDFQKLAIVEVSFPVHRETAISTSRPPSDWNNRPNYKRFKKSRLAATKSIGFMEFAQGTAAQREAELMFSSGRQLPRREETANRDQAAAARHATTSLFVDDIDERINESETNDNNGNEKVDDDDEFSFRFST